MSSDGGTTAADPPPNGGTGGAGAAAAAAAASPAITGGVNEGASGSGLNTLNTRGNAYNKNPPSNKKGRTRHHRLNANQQREAAQQGPGEATAAAERAAVVVGDQSTTCGELEQAMEELRSTVLDALAALGDPGE